MDSLAAKNHVYKLHNIQNIDSAICI